MKEEKQKRSKNQEENQDKENLNNPEGKEAQPVIALTFDEFDALEKQIESLQADIEDKKDQWLRTLADFENYKKRVQRDASRTYEDAMISVIKVYLAVADDLERALKNKPAGHETDSWVNGIELINQKLLNLLKNQRVERMDVNPGDEFDPNFHEAITQEDHPDLDDGKIIEVVQPGYRISDRIIRPAMVRVAR